MSKSALTVFEAVLRRKKEINQWNSTEAEDERHRILARERQVKATHKGEERAKQRVKAIRAVQRAEEIFPRLDAAIELTSTIGPSSADMMKRSTKPDEVRLWFRNKVIPVEEIGVLAGLNIPSPVDVSAGPVEGEPAAEEIGVHKFMNAGFEQWPEKDIELRREAKLQEYRRHVRWGVLVSERLIQLRVDLANERKDALDVLDRYPGSHSVIRI